MKKLLIGLLIALAVMLMLVFALNACDNVVQTAEAAFYQVYTFDGVVRPNALSSYDFSDMTEISSLSEVSSVGVYYSGSVTTSVSAFGTTAAHFTPDGNGHIFIVVDSNFGNLPYFGCMAYFYANSSGKVCYGSSYPLGGQGDTWLSVLNAKNSNSQSPYNYETLKWSYGASTSTSSLFVFEYYSSADVYFGIVKCEGGPNSDASLCFTGFAIPGFTFDPNDYIVPSVYDDWNGVVMPNLLNGADFYEYPLYGHNLGASTGQEAYWTDIPTSNFNRSFVPDFVDDTYVFVPGVSYISYRYNVPAAQQGKAHTYSLYLSTPHKLVITLTSSVTGSTVYEVYNDGVDGLVSLTMPAEQVGSYIYINVQFLSQSSYTVYLYYSKLEVGSFFTGYVPIDHGGDFNVVNYNLMSNYNFYVIPTSTYAINSWYFSQNNPLVVTRGDENGNGITVWTSSSSSVTPTILSYRFDSDDITIGDDLTFGLRGKTDIPFAISITADVSGTSTQLVYYYFLANGYGDQSDFVVHFQYYDNLQIDLIFFEEGQYSLFYAKLENGDRFTGFVADFTSVYSEGYDAGYNVGYGDGLDFFSSNTETYIFDGTAENLTLPIGWVDMGFSSAADLNNAVFSLVPVWYDSQGYTILSSGYSVGYVPSWQRYEVLVYASRFEDLNEELYDEYFNIYYVKIAEHSMTLTAKDDTFPNDWLSYPIYRTVQLTISRASESIIDTVYDQAYRAGFLNGETEGRATGSSVGFNNGRAVGYSEGIQTADNGTWYGLVTALIDVPVTTIVSFLDFDILGFNMLNALKTIALLSLFFFLIRFFVGKVL